MLMVLARHLYAGTAPRQRYQGLIRSRIGAVRSGPDRLGHRRGDASPRRAKAPPGATVCPGLIRQASVRVQAAARLGLLPGSVLVIRADSSSIWPIRGPGVPGAWCRRRADRVRGARRVINTSDAESLGHGVWGGSPQVARSDPGHPLLVREPRSQCLSRSMRYGPTQVILSRL